ncbi:DNA-directed RNA polymerase subunit P [Candidatus Woesearchaeota archaeon]|nr:DNA-directed RNA polymerase subunit P [Candidatus Woesearchaeota archaeon]
MTNVVYKCFSCEKIIKQDYVKKKIRCPYCGYKILYKPRTTTVKILAR